MSYEFITAEVKGRVALLTLNRPKQLNALSPSLMQELGAALYGFDADIGAMKDFDFQHAFKSDYVTRDREHIRNVRKPLIAAVACASASSAAPPLTGPAK